MKFSWLSSLGLGVLAVAGLAHCSSSTPEAESAEQREALSVSCSGVPSYTQRAYNPAERVQNAGSLYECKPWPYSGWCGGASFAYAPGTGSSWQDAWLLVGTCSSGSGGTGGAGGSAGSTSSGGSSSGGSGGTGGASSGGSAGATGYQCPSTCKAPSCVCASPAIPAGLTRATTPQMILVTFDDALHAQSRDAAAKILNGAHKNPNGCSIPATFYVSTQYTDFHVVQQQRARGHEIAVHTMTHTTGTSSSATTWQNEIVGARQAISNLAQLPLADIVGFRAPFLASSDAEFQVLKNNGFLYESSIGEGLGGLSKSTASFIWPYTFDYIGAQTCFVGECPKKAYPGLFEVPMWNWYSAQGGLYSGMDPQGSYAELTELFQRMFTQRYEGNRAPLGLFIHPAWTSSDDHVRAFNDFATWALAKSNVWFVTNRQLVEWMRNPQAAANMAAFAPMACPKPAAGAEICDGWDNNGNGSIDEGLTRACSYPQGHFNTCATQCPTTYPWPASGG